MLFLEKAPVPFYQGRDMTTAGDRNHAVGCLALLLVAGGLYHLASDRARTGGATGRLRSGKGASVPAGRLSARASRRRNDPRTGGRPGGAVLRRGAAELGLGRRRAPGLEAIGAGSSVRPFPRRERKEGLSLFLGAVLLPAVEKRDCPSFLGAVPPSRLRGQKEVGSRQGAKDAGKGCGPGRARALRWRYAWDFAMPRVHLRTWSAR